LEFISDIQIYLQVDDLELNNNPYIFPFKNGVYDLKQKIFRQAYPEEYVTIHSGYDYQYADSNEALQFMKDIIQDEEILEYFLKIIASHLIDKHQREEFFILYNKRGNNGKSTLFLVIMYVFGWFYYQCKSNLLLENNNATGENATPVIYGMKDKRFIAYSEMKRSSTLCATTIKTLTGGDIINARPLYGQPEEFTINGCQMVICQDPPPFDIVDGAVNRRLRIIALEADFVENPILPHQRLIKDIDVKSLRYSFFQLLIENYTENIKKGIQYCPEKIQESSKMYFEKTNLTQLFCNKYLIENSSGYCTENDIKMLVKDKSISREYEFYHKKVNNILEDIYDVINGKIITRKMINGENKRNVIMGYTINQEVQFNSIF
jgi:P4 family phage/plasmid primase-like protien